MEALVEQLEELNEELEEAIEGLEERYDAAAEELTVVSLRPRKSDIDIKQVALAWRGE